jgi:23S rRNA pseudouridine2604 synthase
MCADARRLNPIHTPSSFLAYIAARQTYYCAATVMTEPLRLSKRLIELLGCSRREAELYIEGGWVTVDGVVVDKPQFMVLEQKIELLPGASATPIEPVTLLLHQPAEFVGNDEALLRLLTPATWWTDDPSGIRRLNGHFVRLSHNKILQPGASGMVVFTQDWKTLRKLTEDVGKLEQEYIVDVTGVIAADGLERLKRGNAGNGPWQPQPCKVSWQNENRLRFAIKNPLPGVIKRMCENVGLHVVSMKCIRIGGMPMGKLPVGQWRYLAASERF